MGIAEAIISILTVAPSLIDEATVLYNAVKGSLGSDSQAEIDAAFEKAKASDWAATQEAEDALDAAARR